MKKKTVILSIIALFGFWSCSQKNEACSLNDTLLLGIKYGMDKRSFGHHLDSLRRIGVAEKLDRGKWKVYLQFYINEDNRLKKVMIPIFLKDFYTTENKLYELKCNITLSYSRWAYSSNRTDTLLLGKYSHFYGKPNESLISFDKVSIYEEMRTDRFADVFHAPPYILESIENKEYNWQCNENEITFTKSTSFSTYLSPIPDEILNDSNQNGLITKNQVDDAYNKNENILEKVDKDNDVRSIEIEITYKNHRIFENSNKKNDKIDRRISDSLSKEIIKRNKAKKDI